MNHNMKQSVKRCRQLSLFESFQNCGKKKPTHSMDDKAKSDKRELLASAAEKRLKSNSAPVDSNTARETCTSNSKLNGTTQLSESGQSNKAVGNKEIPQSGNKEIPQSGNKEIPQSVNKELSQSDQSNGPSEKISPSLSGEERKECTEKTHCPSESCSKRPTEKISFSSSDCRNGSADKIPFSQSANSEDLFPDDFTATPNTTSESQESSSGKSSPLSDLNCWPDCCATLPPLTASQHHTILFRPHLRDGSAPRPYPDEYRDRWDSDHVRMPCSSQNRYPVEFPNGEKIIQSRWDLICESLSRRITSSIDLENAIMRYNSQYSSRWNFHGMHAFLNKSLKAAQKTFFFDIILPGMVTLALQLPKICTQPIPLLKKHVDHTITLSQKQIGCLLANAFFCTFPRRNNTGKGHSGPRRNAEYGTYPDINFNRLFIGTKAGISSRNAEKLKCLINYFLRITTKEPSGTVTFHRRYQQVFPNWAASDICIQNAVVLVDGLIETDGHGMLQMDFANSYVGGGVLGQGCIQEEIRFIICPELIVSRLFTEQLTDSEALIVTGVEQYNKYSGYGDSFVWDGDHQDLSTRDAWGRKYTQVVAIDALPFRNSDDQYKLSLIKRELNKAYAGFYDKSIPQGNLTAVATGNWGCGAFKGNPNVKFLIQLMAASQSGRGMLYFTFGDKKLQQTLRNMYRFIAEKKFTVGLIWSMFADYCTDVMCFDEDYRPKLYEYIYGVHFHKDSETDTEIEVIQSSSTICSTTDNTPDLYERNTETTEGE